MWWCHVLALVTAHTVSASHRNMVIILTLLTTLSPIIVITGEAGNQSEARVRDSWPIGGKHRGGRRYQAESDLANNSRTQTSLAKTAIMELRPVQSQCPRARAQLSTPELDRVWMRWESYRSCISGYTIPFYQWPGYGGAERLVFGAIFWLIMFDHAKSRVMIPAKPGLIDTIASAPLRAQSVSD